METTAAVKSYVLVTALAGGSRADQPSSFTYASAAPLAPGQLVVITLGRRRSLGVVMEPAEVPAFATKDVERVLELSPLPQPLVGLAGWLARHYAASLASTWSTILPAGLESKPRATAGKAATKRVPKLQPLPPLTPEQAAVTTAITANPQRSHLLQGVTGSGKTRVYLELAAQALAAGRSAVVLTPEIMLTPQLVATFRQHFGGRVLATHSRLTAAARRNIWLQAAAATEPLIIIGPRSSLFVPVPKLGLIVIDECHESSYKQEQTPRYHAIAAAAKLAELSEAKLVLGSATPGLTEIALTKEGRIALHRLDKRIENRPQPVSTLVDLRDKAQLRTSRFLSQPLLEALEATLAERRQSLLFINRRGSASSQICTDCGQAVLCPNCQLPLTFHADLLRLICHHCNFSQTPVAVCPNCSSSELHYLGGGTKRIESEIARLFPAARVARIDRDSATLAHMTATYEALQTGELDILIGTQMIAKGLDLPLIDTIGVVSADTMLHLPDFSAAERTFDLLVQVAGRAGRGDRPGRVIIQSYTPEHPAIRYAASGDVDGFAEAELAERQRLGYPPDHYLLKLSITAAQRSAAQAKATGLAETLTKYRELTVLGPAPALLETIGGRYHWVIAVKSARRSPLVQIATQVPAGWTADLDPLTLL